MPGYTKIKMSERSAAGTVGRKRKEKREERMEKGWKRRLRHPGIFFKILILFEIILLVTVAATSSYIIKRFTAKMLEKEILLGEMNLEKLTDFCQR